MATIELEHVTKAYAGGVVAVDDVSLAIARRRVHRPRRPVRLRQVDAAAHDRRARGGDRRARSRSAARRHRPRAAATRHRDGLPELRALPAHERPPEHRLRPQGAARRRRPRSRRRVDEVAELLGLDGAARAQAGAALRRPAPAGRDGPRDRARAAGVPDGRAALEPRREAPRRHARVARAAARAARRHDGLRHARPDRGDDARPARRGDARRPDPPGRRRRRRSTRSRATSSSPRSSARRR